MFGLGRKNNIIIRKKECISNKNWNKPNPNADGIRRWTRENRNDYLLYKEKSNKFQICNSNVTNASTSLIPLYFVSVRRNLIAHEYRKEKTVHKVACCRQICSLIFPGLIYTSMVSVTSSKLKSNVRDSPYKSLTAA